MQKAIKVPFISFRKLFQEGEYSETKVVAADPTLNALTHRVGRVLSVSPVVGIGTPPPL